MEGKTKWGEKGRGELEQGEIERIIRKLKKGKTAGEDGVQNKVWL